MGLAVGLAFGLAAGLALGLAAGLAAGLAFGLVGLLELWIVCLALRPRHPPPDIRLIVGQTLWSDSWSNSWSGSWSGGLVGGLAGGLVVGLAGGLVVGLVVRLAGGSMPKVSLTELVLATTGAGRVKFMRVLEDAHHRQVLRQTGAVYQFRHAELQDHLAEIHRRHTRPPTST